MPTGIEENPIDIENGITLFPNPSTGNFTIMSSMPNGSNIKIINTLGEIIIQSHLTNPQLEINLSWVSIGIYFVQITCENKIVNKKLIIQ